MDARGRACSPDEPAAHQVASGGGREGNLRPFRYGSRVFLDNKVAIVTAGGGPGIGSAIVRALSAHGAAVAVTDVNAERAGAVAEELANDGKPSLAVVADVSKKDDVTRMVDETVSAFGTVHILINNAGIGLTDRIETMSEELWRRMLAVHLDGTFLSTQAVIPHMSAHGWGRIVNTASRAAYCPARATQNVGLSAYATAKAAIIGFSRVAAIELGRSGITVNAIAPGLVFGSGMRGEPLVMAHDEEVELSLDEGQVLEPRYVRPDEIAAGVMYFVGPGSDRTTGQVLHINGGSYFNA
jgi:3-oxoacyl-[acyl-carrier protein] reductase